MLYDRLGEVSIESYKTFTEKEDTKKFERDIENWGLGKSVGYSKKYSVGVIVALYLHYKVRENPEFISTVVKLNSDLLSNPESEGIEDVIAFFKTIGLDITDSKKISEYISSELEWIASKDKVSEATL